MKIKCVVAILSGAGLMLPLQAREMSVKSPDGKLMITVADGKESPMLSITREGKTLLAPSPVGMKIQGRTDRMSIGKTKKHAPVERIVDAPFHHTSRFTERFNESEADLGDGLKMIVRAYDDGVAYRFETTGKTPLIIEDEIAEFVFPGNPKAILPHTTSKATPLEMAFQNYYTITPLDSASSLPAFLPAAIDHGDGLKTVILESDLRAYPGMFVQADSLTGSLKGLFARRPSSMKITPRRHQEKVASREDFIATTDGPRTFPWRIFSVTTSDTQMPVSNLVYSMAEPSRLTDSSWIKPGKVAWDWWNDWGLRGVDFKAGINTETYRHYIDFAAENGIEYVVLDEGWYVPQSGDMLTVIPEIDLQALIDYGKQKGVGIVLWTVFDVLDKQLEEAMEKYKAMGAKGFKVDFLDRDDQQGVEMAYRIAEAAARHQMMLDYHGFYKPTGLNRTFPNLVNFEGVYGLEELKWAPQTTDMPRYDVTFPYLRMMQGPADYTQGAMRNAQKKDWKAVYYNPMSQGTRSHQGAAYIVFDSPFVMLCDSPSLYRMNQPWVDFVTPIPTVFDSSRILDGTLGEYIVTLREKDGVYYVGGMTDWTPRDYTVDFSFLPDGEDFEAVIMRDGVNAEKAGDDYLIESKKVTNSSKETIHMAPGGGFAIKLKSKN